VGLVSIEGDGEGELVVVDGVEAEAEAEVEAEKESEEVSTAAEEEEGVDAAGFVLVHLADKVDVEAAGGAEDGSLDEAEALRAL
jgi:hypothetical protein